MHHLYRSRGGRSRIHWRAQGYSLVQFLLPASSSGAGWKKSSDNLGGSLQTMVNEAVANTATYIYATGPGEIATLTLDPSSVPFVKTACKLQFVRYGAGGAGCIYRVKQGATLLATFTDATPPAGYTITELELTQAQAANIVDGVAISVEIEST